VRCGPAAPPARDERVDQRSADAAALALRGDADKVDDRDTFATFLREQHRQKAGGPPLLQSDQDFLAALAVEAVRHPRALHRIRGWHTDPRILVETGEPEARACDVEDCLAVVGRGTAHLHARRGGRRLRVALESELRVDQPKARVFE
jgi:hypothetical protein